MSYKVTIDGAKSEVEGFLAMISKLQKDSARLNWIESHIDQDELSLHAALDQFFGIGLGQSFRDAIDLAMSKQNKSTVIIEGGEG